MARTAATCASARDTSTAHVQRAPSPTHTLTRPHSRPTASTESELFTPKFVGENRDAVAAESKSGSSAATATATREFEPTTS